MDLVDTTAETNNVQYTQTDELKQLSDKYEKIIAENEKMWETIVAMQRELEKITTDNVKFQTIIAGLHSDNEKNSVDPAMLLSTVTGIKSDVDKLKGQISDKITKAVLAEFECKINSHTKALDATSKKLFEVQTNVNTYVQQPLSHTLIDTIRKQLVSEITANTNSVIELQTEKLIKLVDERNKEAYNRINNAKKFMYR
jgi:hypothetical protein